MTWLEDMVGFVEFFSEYIFEPQLVESVGMRPQEMMGPLYLTAAKKTPTKTKFKKITETGKRCVL